MADRKNIENESKDQKRRYSKISSIFWAVKYIWRTDHNFIFFVFASVPIAVILPLIEAYFPKELIDKISAGSSFGQLFGISAAFILIITLLKQLESFIQGKCRGRRYYQTSICQTDLSAFKNYKTDYENTEKQDFHKVAGFANDDMCHGNCSVEFVWEDLQNICIHILGIATYSSLLILLDPIIFAVVAVISILSYFMTRWQPVYYEKHKQQWEKEIRKKDYLQGLSEDFSRAKDIKLYGLENWLDKMMQDYQAYILMWNKRCRLRGFFASILSGGMAFLQNGTAYVVLIKSLLAGSITVGEFVFYFGLVAEAAGFLQGIIGDVAKLNTRAEKIAYYRTLFDYPNHFNHKEGCKLPDAPVTIEFKDVWYRYDGAKDYTLKGINLVISGGEKLALVGVNGAGKTTLIKLLCGMYTPTKGEILVGGKKIEEYNIEEYYSIISAVFQEIRYVAFTIFEFVASADLARPTARKDAVEAMEAAGIYEKVKSLENDMDTHLMKGIYDDGVDFSGGEMQKLVLARAIYKNSAIFVLDEPTAALDPIAENNLYLKYQELTNGRTSVYISHRFASTRFCDRIILLADGIIKESGTHKELMEQGGQYAYMFGVQSKYYKEGDIHE